MLCVKFQEVTFEIPGCLRPPLTTTSRKWKLTLKTKHMKTILIAFLLVFCADAMSAQLTLVHETDIEEKSTNVELVIPIAVKAENLSTAQTVTLTVDNATAPAASRFTLVEMGSVTLSASTINLGAAPTEVVVKTVYLKLRAALVVDTEKQLVIRASVGGVEFGNVTVVIRPAPESRYTLDDYLDRESGLYLTEIVRVESADDVITLHGYAHDGDGRMVQRKIGLKQGQVLKVSNKIFPKWFRPAISLTTVPVKVRPSLDGKATAATSGLSNLGLNTNFFGYKSDRYFADGTKSTHKFGLGLWAAPSVEELGVANVDDPTWGADRTSKQLFVSAGISLTYSYNAINFIFIPAGFDFATSTVGRKYSYDGKRWWGFGIGVDVKVFEAILNK